MMGETETMLKIFLAEDEIVMREGIRNNIAWQEEGFEFVGEASDGELAYPMIQKLKPDILITDTLSSPRSNVSFVSISFSIFFTCSVILFFSKEYRFAKRRFASS